MADKPLYKLRLEIRDASTGQVVSSFEHIDHPTIFRTRRAVFELMDEGLCAGNVVSIISKEQVR